MLAYVVLLYLMGGYSNVQVFMSHLIGLVALAITLYVVGYRLARV